jgi:hypothetical protein
VADRLGHRLVLGGLGLDAHELPGRRVDVVTEASLHPALRDECLPTRFHRDSGGPPAPQKCPAPHRECTEVNDVAKEAFGF